MVAFFRFLLILLCFYLSFPLPALAHFAATDGNITITLHVDPNDDPPPGQNARVSFYFAYNDSTKSFDINNCNCVVTISEQGKQLFKKQLNTKSKQPSVYGASVPFVFPKKDVYIVTIKGSPLTPKAFKPFYLTWDFRDDGNPQDPVPSGPPDIPVLIASWIIGIIIVILIGLFIKNELASSDHVDSNKKH